MIDVKFFNDEHAKRVHREMRAALAEVVARMCPGHELSHFGINRNDLTEEIQIRLHLNPLGRVRVVPDALVDEALEWGRP